MKPNGNTPKKLPKYITKEEIIMILDAAKKDSYRNYIMLLTMWRTGVRRSEVISIQKRDIIDGMLEVRDGKGHKDRVIPLENELENLLGLFSDRLRPNDKLFPMSNRNVDYIVEKYRHRDDISAHTFRHSFAVYCLKNGMNLRTLQKILGHSSLTTTQIYLDIAGTDLKDDFGKVDW